MYKQNENDDDRVLIVYVIIGLLGTIFLGNELKDNYLYVQNLLFIILEIIALIIFILVLKIVITKNTYKTTINFLVVSGIYVLYVNYINNLLPEIVNRIPNDLSLHKLKDLLLTAYTLVGLLILFLTFLFILSFIFRIIALTIEELNSNSISRFIIKRTQSCEKTVLCLVLIIVLTVISYLFTTGVIFHWLASI
ncbi:hypothetical protein [Staphylococcus pettenkoferi]|nr:hypothetical protein [Staphylococcus pettenkoferi]MCY1569644.1 hypothetical protein [Staphylococcus pettenkoferi]MCY1576089.1 hypothetical protein [Staphylococcus pettenkoferi]MCY1617642.1 hypothetical protein [Staphylococcus pettenkoferi]